MQILNIEYGDIVIRLHADDCLRLSQACTAAADVTCGATSEIPGLPHDKLDAELCQLFEGFAGMFAAAATALQSHAYLVPHERHRTETSLAWLRENGTTLPLAPTPVTSG